MGAGAAAGAAQVSTDGPSGTAGRGSRRAVAADSHAAGPAARPRRDRVSSRSLAPRSCPRLETARLLSRLRRLRVPTPIVVVNALTVESGACSPLPRHPRAERREMARMRVACAASTAALSSRRRSPCRRRAGIAALERVGADLDRMKTNGHIRLLPRRRRAAASVDAGARPRRRRPVRLIDQGGAGRPPEEVAGRVRRAARSVRRVGDQREALGSRLGIACGRRARSRRGVIHRRCGARAR